MKNSNRIHKQTGFFDLGLSVIILAIGGTTLAVSDANIADSDSQQIQISRAVSEDVSGYDYNLDSGSEYDSYFDSEFDSEFDY